MIIKATGKRTTEPEIVEIKGKKYHLDFYRARFCMECGAPVELDSESEPDMKYSSVDGHPVYYIRAVCSRTKKKWWGRHLVPSTKAREVTDE